MQQVDIDFENRRATCTVTPSEFNQDQALETLKKAGYPGKIAG